MEQEEEQLAGPDLRQGIAFDEIHDGGMLAGHAGSEQILLVRRREEVFAVGALCAHYQALSRRGSRLALCPSITCLCGMIASIYR
jgi:nitrite reductase/ring-hydroxylating ferredoxin subunit